MRIFSSTGRALPQIPDEMKMGQNGQLEGDTVGTNNVSPHEVRKYEENHFSPMRRVFSTWPSLQRAAMGSLSLKAVGVDGELLLFGIVWFQDVPSPSLQPLCIHDLACKQGLFRRDQIKRGSR
jgi:hypothetical protein